MMDVMDATSGETKDAFERKSVGHARCFSTFATRDSFDSSQSQTCEDPEASHAEG